jgi:hypothetical protein
MTLTAGTLLQGAHGSGCHEQSRCVKHKGGSASNSLGQLGRLLLGLIVLVLLLLAPMAVAVVIIITPVHETPQQSATVGVEPCHSIRV